LVQTVVKVEGDMTVMKGFGNCPTCLVYFDKNYVLIKVEQADGTPPDPAAIGLVPMGSEWKMFDFPLQVGKKWNIAANGHFRNDLLHFNGAMTIQAYEGVATKAGTFKAFKISRDWSVTTPSNSGGRGFSFSTTEWYAPDVKRIVKYTTTATNPNQKDWELVSYTVK